MDELLDGVAAYQATVHATNDQLFAGLATGQSPQTMFITCADSRVDPSLITQHGPGELFVSRNVGNVIPPASSQDLNPDGMAAALEYAVQILKVSQIVVCGHSDCGAMKAALSPESVHETTYIKTWIEFSRVAIHSADEPLDVAIQHNVVHQIANLKTYDFVDQALRNGTLSVAGWVYDIGTGAVSIHGDDGWQQLHSG